MEEVADGGGERLLPSLLTDLLEGKKLGGGPPSSPVK